MPRISRNTFVILGCVGALLLPSSAGAQSTPLSPIGSFWVTPYLGIGFQGEYYDDVVQFSDGGTDFLRINPGSGLVYGVQLGYRFRPSWTLQVNVASSAPDAEYVEDLRLRPDVELRTSQLEVGVLYDLSTFPVGGKIAPFLLGGGLSLTFHSLDRFTWGGQFVEPSSTSIGVHGLAALDIPLAPKVSLRGQAKFAVISLSLGDLEEKIAFAEDGGVTATLDSGITTYLVISAGVTVRL